MQERFGSSARARSDSYFAQVADDWDALRAGYFSDAVREAAIVAAFLRPEMVVADVGCGTGFMAEGLARRVRQVLALDASSAMLRVARAKRASYANIAWCQAEGERLPLDDASVDAVFANMFLHHCPDPGAAIREMVRVLRPGGRLLITDLEAHTHTWFREEMADEWLGFEPQQVRGWFRAAGLVNVVVRPSGQCCSTTTVPDTAGGREASVRVFLARGSRKIAGATEAVQGDYEVIAISDGSCCGTANSDASCCSPLDVREKGSSSCCDVAPEVGFGFANYAAEELAELPPEASTLALGCGNPVAFAALRPGEVVLDIGSGGGLDAFYAARCVGPAGHVIGLDMTPAMVTRARQAAKVAGIDNVEFRLGQAEAIPMPAGSVDVVLSNCVINLCQDKGKVFTEAYRVLREGGRLVISDMVSAEPLPLSLHADITSWSGCIHGALPEQEYLDLIAEAGFREIAATRSRIALSVAGVSVYSLLVTARKGTGTGDQMRSSCGVIPLTPALKSAEVEPGCCVAREQ